MARKSFMSLSQFRAYYRDPKHLEFNATAPRAHRDGTMRDYFELTKGEQKRFGAIFKAGEERLAQGLKPTLQQVQAVFSWIMERDQRAFKAATRNPLIPTRICHHCGEEYRP